MKRKLVSIIARLKRERPDIDPFTAIAAHRVYVGGVRVDNPRAQVHADLPLAVVDDTALRGTVKLRAALARFTPEIRGKVALDLGACTGGFTVALLEEGAACVYAVDAGYGQLLGSLRLDARVVNLERTNLGALDTTLVPDVIDVVTADLSYVSLASAVAQLEQPGKLAFADRAVAILLVKPMFELALPAAPLAGDPDVDERLAQSFAHAAVALHEHGWRVEHALRSPVTGTHGAVEGFLCARRVSRGRRHARSVST